MKKMFAVLALLVATAMTFVACGGDDEKAASAPPATTVSTPQQGAQAAAVSTSAAANVVQGTVGLTGMLNSSNPMPASKFKRTTALGKAMTKAVASMKKAKSFTAKVPQTTDCIDGGTQTIDYPMTQTPPITITMSATNCKENQTLSNGTMSFTITATGMTMVNNYTETMYSDSNYTTVSSIRTANQTISMAESGTTVSISMNGSEVYEDKVANTKDEQSFTGVTFTGTDNTVYPTDGSMPTSGDISMTVNGSYSFKYYINGTLDNSDSASFYNLKVDSTWTSTSETTSINGTFSADVFPNDPCVEGTYSFKTITPMTMDSTGMTTAGKIEINGTVMVTFLSDGSVTVSVNGGTATPYTAAELSTMCATI